jgi:hypothetical protein
MKKSLLLVFVLTLLFSLASCNQEDESSKTIELDLTLEEIIDEVYAQSGVELPATMKTPLTSENMSYMLGADSFEFLEGLASEPMMSAQAHSVVLFTVDESADIANIKKEIKANVDGRKWICVGVEEEDILVEDAGQYVILIMDEQSEALMSAFKNIVK